MLAHWIWLSTRSGLGDYNRKRLLEKYKTPERIFQTERKELEELGGLTGKALDSLMDRSLAESEEILRVCADRKISVLTWQDTLYPQRLKAIEDPPVVLYYKGRLPEFDRLPAVGVVGTRSASSYGLTSAKRLGYQIASCGGAVISGMAAGVDAMAMKGALTAGGWVIGVLGCGADVIYPLENRGLFADTEGYGCILSEFVPGTRPLGKNFPRRNRLISGLSCGVLVVEAPEGSGALITARLAAEQGRDVFVVPGNIDNPGALGSNRLMREGATPVSSGWDVMSEYAAQFPDLVKRGGMDVRLRAYPDEVAKAARNARKRDLKVAQKPRKMDNAPSEPKKETKKVIDKSQNEPYIDLNKIEASLTADEKAIVSQLTGGQKLVDDVIAGSGLSAGTVLASLTLLEVKGIVRRLPGRMVVLAGGK